MKNIFKFPKLTAYKLCTLSMLVAITALLAAFCTFRIGDAVKIPLKFISVFIASALFGPWLGGLCGALGDIFNILFPIIPVPGPPMPLITVLEFFVGFVYGVFFYNRPEDSHTHILRCILCAAAVFLSDIFLSTAVLIQAGIFPSFDSAIILRLPAGIIKALLQLIFFILSKNLITTLKKIGRI